MALRTRVPSLLGTTANSYYRNAVGPGISAYDRARLAGRLWQPSPANVGLTLGRPYGIGFVAAAQALINLSQQVWPVNDALRITSQDPSPQFVGLSFPLTNMTSGSLYAISYTVSAVSAPTTLYVRVSTDPLGTATGSIYEGGDVGPGSYSGTLTPTGATYYLHLINDDNSGWLEITSLSLALNSVPTRDKERVSGYIAHSLRFPSGLPASHPYRNTPPLIGDTALRVRYLFSGVIAVSDAQIAVPISDITDGSWTNELDSNVNLYDSIDETAYSDSDYIKSTNLGVTAGFLRNAVPPGISAYDRARLAGRLWTPTHLTTKPHAWYDAQQGPISYATGVSQWNDRARNSHATQATTANQPAYTASTYFGSRPSINCDGSNDGLVASIAIAGGQLAAFLVARRRASTNANQRLLSFTASTGFDFNDSRALSLEIGLDGTALQALNLSTIYGTMAWPVNTESVLSYVEDGSTSTWWKDGTTGTPAVFFPAFDIANVGIGYRANDGNEPSDFAYGEVLLFGYAPSTSERTRIEGYLAHRWGLTANLPASHPYKRTPPLIGDTPLRVRTLYSGSISVIDTCEVGVTALSDPGVSTGHIVYYRYRAQGARTMNFEVSLMQGSYAIATWTHTGVSTTYASATQTLTAAQADSISDYTTLRLRFTAIGT